MKLSIFATSILLIGISSVSLAQNKGLDPDWKENMNQQAQEARAKYEALPTLEM